MAEDPDPSEPQPLPRGVLVLPPGLPPSALVPTPLVRRNLQPSDDRPALPPDIEAQLNQLAQTVQVLSAHFLGQNTADAPLETAKERSARRPKKFQRVSGDERPAANGLTDETMAEPPVEGTAGEASADTPDETDSLARNKHIAWPRQNPSEGAPATASAFPQWGQLKPATRLRLGALAGGLLLLGLGLLTGRATAPHYAVKAGKSSRIGGNLFGASAGNEQALITANDALHAEHTGNADAARKLYETAVNKQVDLPGVNYRLALLALQRNDREEAQERLERSVLAGEEVAECCYLLARLAADQGDLEEQSNQFEAATHARPFDGRYFFFYAETLRRQGKPQAAVAAFERALDRPYAAGDGDLYLFKERLAKLEFGRDDVFNAELAARLKQEPVGGDWLLLAAAQNLDRQEFVAAADRLRQAANRLPSGTYADLTHDYVFQTHAKRSEVATLLNRVVNPAISSAGPTVLDPASWSPQRADPAVWPTTATQSAR